MTHAFPSRLCCHLSLRDEQVEQHHPGRVGKADVAHFPVARMVRREQRLGEHLGVRGLATGKGPCGLELPGASRSEEHTSELQSLMRSSYAVLCQRITHELTNRARYPVATPN